MTNDPRAQEFDRGEVFEDLMTLRDRVFGICLGFSRNAQDAEELAQDAYLKAFRGLPRLRDRSLAREWLFRIARNTALDHCKKNRTVRFVRLDENTDPPDGPGPDEDREKRERIAVLKRAVARLPRKLREILVLREYGELSYEEIAAVLDAKMGTVMSRLNRARRALAANFKEARDGR